MPLNIVYFFIQVTNYSGVLPIKYECQALAHYKCHPFFGIIMNESTVTFRVSFLPRQLGLHNSQLLIHFWGPEVKVFGYVLINFYTVGIKIFQW